MTERVDTEERMAAQEAEDLDARLSERVQRAAEALGESAPDETTEHNAWRNWGNHQPG